MAELPGHTEQSLLRGPDDHREDEEGQGQRAGEDGDPKAKDFDEEGQAEQPEDHRGHPGEVVHRHADGPDERALPGILHQVDRGTDPQRKGEEKRPRSKTERSYQCGKDSALGHRPAGEGGEELPGDRSGPAGEDEGQDRPQSGQHSHHGQRKEREGHPLGRPPH